MYVNMLDTVLVYVIQCVQEGGRLKLEEMDEPGSDPRLSCDPYITFYCINFLPNVTKYWIQYFSHTVPLSLSHTQKKISRWKIRGRKRKACPMVEKTKQNKSLSEQKIILKNANLQFFFLSGEMNSSWPLVPCKQTKVFPTVEPRPLHSQFRSVRRRSFVWEIIISRVKPCRQCLLTLQTHPVQQFSYCIRLCLD